MRSDLAPWRLRPQLLVGPPAPSPAAVARHLGAVQAQEHLWAPWAVGRRCGATLTEVLDGLWAGGVVRTHALRTTWHYVHRDDLPMVVAATADRVMAQLVAHTRRAGLDEPRLLAASDVITRAVREAPGCTRAHLAERLRDAGYDESGDRLAHVVMAAELRGDIAGERRRGQHEYHPIDMGPLPPVDDALAWLARTYARGHGPFTDRDLAWWSSLTLRQARTAIELADLRRVTVAGVELRSLDEPAAVPVPPVLLLANFDELISHARDATVKTDAGVAYEDLGRAGGLVFVDGRLSGPWRRTVTADGVDVDVTTHVDLDRRHRDALAAEIERYRRFVTG